MVIACDDFLDVSTRLSLKAYMAELWMYVSVWKSLNVDREKMKR